MPSSANYGYTNGVFLYCFKYRSNGTPDKINNLTITKESSQFNLKITQLMVSFALLYDAIRYLILFAGDLINLRKNEMLNLKSSTCLLLKLLGLFLVKNYCLGLVLLLTTH